MRALSPRAFWFALFAMIAAALPAAAEGPAAGSKTFSFDADSVGSLPAGFEFARTGHGAEGKWVVRADKDRPGNHVLVQESADPTDYRFPLAVVKEGPTGTPRCRSEPGLSREKWTRASASSGATRMPTITTSPAATPMRTTARSTTPSPVAGGPSRTSRSGWPRTPGNTLKLEASGNHFAVWFDGTKVLDATDDTFKDAGRVGLWTKADSVIQFDDFSIEGH